MTDCNGYDKRLIPLSRVVNAALIDSYEDVGKSREIYSHWTARGVRKLQKEALRLGIKRVLLTVNHNTKTATLPPDCDDVQFVGYIENGVKVPLTIGNNLINDASIEDIPCEDACPKCNEDKGICNDLTVSEEEEIVIVNSGNYTKTTIKKLYPNGDYYLETTIPYYNTVTVAVEYVTTKEFIVALDLKSCGCPERTEENIEKIRCCNSDVYDCYYSGCSTACDSSIGGYKIFPESGLIQLDYRFKKEKVYIEYVGFMPKVNGQYAIPEVAFETLVAWVKWKSVENRRNILPYERDFIFKNYRRERCNMEKMMGRISLSSIINAINQTPKFDIDLGYGHSTGCIGTSNEYVSQITSSKVSDDVCSSVNASCGTNNGTTHVTPFQLAVIAGNGSGTPVAGEYTYTNLGLVGALNLNSIIINNNNETTLNGDFTFNSITGTITRINPWIAGDTLIAAFAKLV